MHPVIYSIICSTDMLLNQFHTEIPNMYIPSSSVMNHSKSFIDELNNLNVSKVNTNLSENMLINIH